MDYCLRLEKHLTQDQVAKNSFITRQKYLSGDYSLLYARILPAKK